MSRNQLIQLGIITVALIAGYKFFESVISTLVVVVFQYGGGYDDSLKFVFQYLLFLGIYFLAFFLLVRFREPIARYIDRQGRTDSIDAPEMINVRVREEGLIFVVIIALCLITFVEDLPVLVIAVVNSFKKEAGGFRGGSPNDLQFKTEAIRFVFTVIILFSARRISNWLGNLWSTGPVIETTDHLSPGKEPGPPGDLSGTNPESDNK